MCIAYRTGTAQARKDTAQNLLEAGYGALCPGNTLRTPSIARAHADSGSDLSAGALQGFSSNRKLNSVRIAPQFVYEGQDKIHRCMSGDSITSTDSQEAPLLRQCRRHALAAGVQCSCSGCVWLPVALHAREQNAHTTISCLMWS